VPTANSTLSLKLALLSAAAIAEKSKVANAGSPLFGRIVVKKHSWFHL
jgi:hypothetical protein